MSRGVWIALLVLFAPSLAAEECDCTVAPFKPDPPCWDLCVAQLLQQSDLQRLQSVLQLSPSTVEGLDAARSKNPRAGFDEIIQLLQPDDASSLRAKLEDLSSEDLESLIQPEGPDYEH